MQKRCIWMWIFILNSMNIQNCFWQPYCVWEELSEFIKNNILICVPKMNEGLTGWFDMRVSN